MPGSKLRYRDALGGWSAPANNPGLKYYDAKAQWSVPSKNPKLKYRDALGQWSAPAVEAPSIGDMSWEALSALANAAAANPDEYQQYVGETRTVHLMPIDRDAETVLVGVGQDETQYGGKTGFTFWVKDLSGFETQRYTYATFSLPYADSPQGKYLSNFSIKGCSDSLIVPHKVSYWYGHAGDIWDKGLDTLDVSYHRFSPLVEVNVKNNNYLGTWDFPGETYYYFSDDGLGNVCEHSNLGMGYFDTQYAALLDFDWSPEQTVPPGQEGTVFETFFHYHFSKQRIEYDGSTGGILISDNDTSYTDEITTVKFCLGSYEG